MSATPELMVRSTYEAARFADPVAGFRDAMVAAGLKPPAEIIPDGEIHRFGTNGKRSDSAGWYVLHADGLPAGIFGCWRAGWSQKWCAKPDGQQTAGERAEHRARIEAMQQRREADEAQRRAAARKKAATIWQAATPAPADHPYLIAKGIQAHGLRVHDGALIVPMHDGAGELHSVQRIYPNGDKRFLTGGRVTGCCFTIGRPADVLYIAEGFATAATIHEATGAAVVAAFNAGNLLPAAQAMRAKFPHLRLAICADDDAGTPDNPGLTKAREAAEAVNAALAVPDFGADRPNGATDFNDLAQHAGLDAVRRYIDAAVQRPDADRHYKLLTAADIEAMPPLAWRIKGVMPARGLAQIYGPSKAGKSFLAFDMACAIAEGRRWFDYRVHAAPVVYAVLEGEAGFKLRAEAWKRHAGRPLPDGLYMIMQPFRIDNAEDVRALADAVPADGVLVIDTQNRAAPTADENSSKDMGAIIEGAKTLQRLTDGLVVLVAHTGKDASKGPRGHSSQTPAVDAAIEVRRDGDQRSWRADKVKDGRDGSEHGFSLEILNLGSDADGDPLTSCAIHPTPAVVRQKMLSESQRQGIAAYCIACDEGNGELDSAGAFIGLHLEAWRETFYAMHTADTQEAKRKSFERVRKTMQVDGLLTVLNDVYRVTDPSASVREKYFVRAAQTRTTGQDPDKSRTCPGT